MLKSILVCGASSKIGQVLCHELSDLGYVIFAGYRNHLTVPKGRNIIPIKLDITSDTLCQKAVKEVLRSKNKLTAVVNLVGASYSGETISLQSQDFNTILDTNTVGAFRVMKAVLPHLPKGGRVINIGSLSGIISFPNFGLYSASKFALRALSLSLYHEWLPRKRYVVCLSLGAVANDSNRVLAHNSARSRIPLLGLLLPLTTPAKVAKIVAKTIIEKKPPAEVLVGNDTVLLSLLYRLLPAKWWNSVQQYIWQKQQ